MPKRYINSADALNTLKHLAYETALNQHDPYVADVFEDIAKNRLETWVDLIPTADVIERKKGKWEFIGGYGYQYRCSACIMCAERKTNFCPHCGASMREGGAE